LFACVWWLVVLVMMSGQEMSCWRKGILFAFHQHRTALNCSFNVFFLSNSKTVLITYCIIIIIIIIFHRRNKNSRNTMNNSIDHYQVLEYK